MTYPGGWTNRYGQPIGAPVPGWSPRARPDARALTGTSCRLERLDPARHAAELFAADRVGPRGAGWTYLPYGPFNDVNGYTAWLTSMAAVEDPYFFAIIDSEPGSAT